MTLTPTLSSWPTVSWLIPDGQRRRSSGECGGQPSTPSALLRLEGTYTGKALAAAMHAGEGPDLFWCTLSRQAIEPLFGEGPPPDPAAWGFVTA